MKKPFTSPGTEHLVGKHVDYISKCCSFYEDRNHILKGRILSVDLENNTLYLRNGVFETVVIECIKIVLVSYREKVTGCRMGLA